MSLIIKNACLYKQAFYIALSQNKVGAKGYSVSGLIL